MYHRGRSEAGRGQRGFSLIEMLIVVAIIGLITMIMTIAVSNALKRQRLEVAARQLQSMIEKAYVLQGQSRNGVFVVLNPSVGTASATKNVDLVVDTDGNGQLSSAEFAVAHTADTRLLLSNDIVVTACTWPAIAVGGVNVNAVLCDTMGRTMNPSVAPPTQFTTASISLTHRDMQAGKLKPRMRFDVEQGILWRVIMSNTKY